MVAPSVTYLQALILACVAGGVRKAKGLRRALRRKGIRQPVQSFHESMTRLETKGLLAGEYVKASRGARGRERAFRLTVAGRSALRQALKFSRAIESAAGD